MQISFEEPPPLSFTLAMTMLRSIAAMVVIAYGWQNWQQLANWKAELVRFGVVEPEVAATWILAAIFLLGLGLALGWMTRLWSFGLLCSTLSVLAVAYANGSLHLGAFEYPLLVAAVSFVLLTTGGGRISVDRFLFERAQRRAIEADERWQHPPYVPATPRR
jgi:putative oxidoreductase